MAKKLDDFELSNQDKEGCEEFLSLFNQNDTDEGRGSVSTLVTCRIVKINKDSVMVDIGQKAEKAMNISEITDEKTGELLFKEGDEIELLITNNKISYRQALKQKQTQKVIEEIKDNFEDMIIEVKIVDKNKGGYIVFWKEKEIDCFMPKQQSAIKQTTKTNNKTIKVCIIKIDDNSIIVSRKRYFDINEKKRKDKIKEIMEADSALKGEVVNITNFGIFVNIDGVEGLVHSSEMTHKNFANPANLYKIGDNVLVKVIEYNEEKDKLSLSIKALIKDPWEDIERQLQVGYTIKAVVSSIQPYGVFVDAGNDIEGFLHITEISWEKNIKRPNDYLQVGQEIDVEIIELDPARKRLRVSLKKLTEKPFMQFAKKYKEGDIIKGKVATITDFGAFLRFGNIDGLLHNEDLSWDKQERCKDVLKLGDEIEVKILKIDKTNEKISLSRKAVLESPANIFNKTHKVGDVISGKIVEIKDFGVFVNLDKNIDALIKNEDLSPLKKEELKIGDNIEASIFHIDAQNGKIRLSVKKLVKKKEQDEIKNYSNDEKMTLGDILKDRIK